MYIYEEENRKKVININIIKKFYTKKKIFNEQKKIFLFPPTHYI